MGRLEVQASDKLFMVWCKWEIDIMKKWFLFILILSTFGMMGQSCDGSGDQHAPQSFNTTETNGNVAPVPEPSGALIIGVALIISSFIVRNRKS